MVDALGQRFDVSVKHSASATAAHPVPNPVNIQPFRGGFFAATDLLAHVGIENLSASAGDRPKAAFTKEFERFRDRHSENAVCQVTNLDGGERLNMQIRIKGAQALQQIQVPLFLQSWM